MIEPLKPSDSGSIGPYRLLGRLGHGGMGEVFQARSQGGRLIAIKTIQQYLLADPEFVERFRYEAEAARRVNGLFTAVVIDADADAPVPWLATATYRLFLLMRPCACTVRSLRNAASSVRRARRRIAGDSRGGAGAPSSKAVQRPAHR
jgi:hypothetical protein